MKPGRHAAIRVTRRYSAPAESVFGAWLDPEVAGRWLFATASRPMTSAEIDARVGGSFRFAERRGGEKVDYSGRYVEITPPRRLAFTLSVRRQSLEATRVVVEIVPLKAGCALHLTHDKVPRRCASRAETRWTGILYGLGVTLEAALGDRYPGDGNSRRKPLSNSGSPGRL